jgi:hypothetical protein
MDFLGNCYILLYTYPKSKIPKNQNKTLDVLPPLILGAHFDDF